MDFRFPLLLWDPKNLKKTETCFGCDLADCGRASMDFEGEMHPTNCIPSVWGAQISAPNGCFFGAFLGLKFQTYLEDSGIP